MYTNSGEGRVSGKGGKTDLSGKLEGKDAVPLVINRLIGETDNCKQQLFQVTPLNLKKKREADP